MCGRITQSSGPLDYGLVEGMNVRDSRFANRPPRWNGAPGQVAAPYRSGPQQNMALTS